MTLFVDQFNRVQPFPSKLPKLVSELVGPGFALKVDGVVLLGTDKIPTGDVYEVVEVAVVPSDDEPTVPVGRRTDDDPDDPRREPQEGTSEALVADPGVITADDPAEA